MNCFDCVVECSFYACHTKGFQHEVCWILSNAFNASVERTYDFYFLFVNVMYHISWSTDAGSSLPLCSTWMYPTWSSWMLCLMRCWICWLVFCWGSLNLCSSRILVLVLFLSCFSVALVLKWYWLYRKCLEDLPRFLLLGKFGAGLGKIPLEMCVRIQQWSHLV